jgi:ribosomal protein S27E
LRRDEDPIVATVLPHSDFGDAKCCGCLNGVIQGDQALIVCNECGTIVKTVPASELQRTFDQMEPALASAICPHCRPVHLNRGFSEMDGVRLR